MDKNEKKDFPSGVEMIHTPISFRTLKPTEIEKWHELHPKTKLINMYGITETTVHVTYKELQPEDLELAKSNIGKPIPGLKILLLDKNLKLVPHGVPGEICARLG